MSSKMNGKQRRDNKQDYRRVEEMEKIRILQDNLVFVSGLPSSLSHSKVTTQLTQVLRSQQYFGQYGQVEKIAVNSSPSYRRNNMIQVYATFCSKLEASLAIVALDGFNLNGKPIKASYGTTKYCTHFLRGYECQNSECFYLHQIDKSREIANGDTRDSFQHQNDRAFDIVNQNLEKVVTKMLATQHEACESGFPSLEEMIDFLIDSEFLLKSDVDQLISKNDKTKLPQLQQMVSCPENQTENSGMSSPKDAKLIKCSSFSTMASPTKSQTQQSNTVQQNLEKQKEIEKKEDNTKTQEEGAAKKEREQKIEECLEQKIQKMIIKRIFSSSAPKSRMGFVSSGDKDEPKQLNQLKVIVQKCLIAAN